MSNFTDFIGCPNTGGGTSGPGVPQLDLSGARYLDIEPAFTGYQYRPIVGSTNYIYQTSTTISRYSSSGSLVWSVRADDIDPGYDYFCGAGHYDGTYLWVMIMRADGSRVRAAIITMSSGTIGNDSSELDSGFPDISTSVIYPRYWAFAVDPLDADSVFVVCRSPQYRMWFKLGALVSPTLSVLSSEQVGANEVWLGELYGVSDEAMRWDYNGSSLIDTQCMSIAIKSGDLASTSPEWYQWGDYMYFRPGSQGAALYNMADFWTAVNAAIAPLGFPYTLLEI